MSPIQETFTEEVVLRMDQCIRSSSDLGYEGLFQNLPPDGPAVVTLDLSALEKINPQTVRLILLFWERLWRCGKVLRICGLHGNSRDLFQRLKIDRYIRCLP